MADHYLDESLWKRAWKDSKAGWKSLPLLLLQAIGSAAVGSVFMWYWGIVLFVSAMTCVGIAATIRASVAQRNDARYRVRELEEERAPHIAVKPHVGRRTWDYEHEYLMWAELHVTNTSSSLILKDAGVRIVGCLNVVEKQNEPGSYLLHELHKWNPTNVYWSIRDAQPLQLKLHIPPNTTRTSLIAFSKDSNGPPAICNSPQSPKPQIHLGSRLEIEVSSLNAATWKGVFYLECHPNYVGGDRARFEFIEWELWKQGKTILTLLD